METNHSAVKPSIVVSWSSATVAEVEVIVAGNLGNWWFGVGLDKKSQEVTFDPVWFAADRKSAKPGYPSSDEHIADHQAAKVVLESVKTEAVRMLMATLDHTEKDYSTMVQQDALSVAAERPSLRSHH